MRLFVAVVLGEAVEAHGVAAIERLRPRAPHARFVKAEGLHLTLSFLGEVDPARLPELREALARVAPRHAPLTLSIGGGGTFGAPSHPRVLWAGVGGDVKALQALQADVAGALEALGFPRDERAYSPHLTLARAKTPRGDAALGACAHALHGATWGEAPVDRLILFESRGGHYHPQGEAPLTRPV
ncbi:RNA 2',3'-cyclic phosphodiesterase [Myxococcaceae bacterium GXIMD 01537]